MDPRKLVFAVAALAVLAVGAFLLVAGREPAAPAPVPVAPPPGAPPKAPDAPVPAEPPPAPPAPVPAPAEPPAPAAASLLVRVLDAADGAPVAGAAVEVERAEGDPLSLSTDAAGCARAAGLAPGGADLLVRAPGRVRGTATALLEAGRESAVEMRLDRGGAVAGRVLDAKEGTPLAGASVVVVPGGALKRSGGGSASLLTFDPPFGGATTDAEGRFRVEGVGTGNIVTVRAGARGHGSAEEGLVLEREGAAAREVVLRLPRAGVLRGVVRLPDGKPAGGALVHVLPADAEDMLAYPDGTSVRGGRTIRALAGTAGPDGAYEVEGLDLDAAYVAAAKGPGRSRTARGIVPTEAEPAVSADFALLPPGHVRVRVLRPDGTPEAGASVHVFQLGFPPTLPHEGEGVYVLAGAAAGKVTLQVRAPGFRFVQREVEVPEEGDALVEVRLEKGFVLSGVLVDDRGEPVAGARIHVSRPWQLAGKVPASEGDGVTDASGRFRVDGLLDGTHCLILAGERRVALPGGVGDSRVEVPAEGVRVVAHRKGSLRLRLVLPPGGTAPAEVTLGIGRKEDGGESLSRSGVPWNGGNVVLEGVAPGEVRVLVEAAGFAPGSREAVVKVGEPTDLGEIALDPGLDLEGRVVDAGGRPIEGATASAGELWTPVRQDAATDGDGRFLLRHLPRGGTEVEVAAEGFLGASVPATLPLAKPLVVVLRRGGLLSVRAVDAEGRPAGGAKVRWTLKGGGEDDNDAEETDHRGVHEVRLAAGTWTVALLDDDWKEVGTPGSSKEVEVAEGGTAAVELRR